MRLNVKKITLVASMVIVIVFCLDLLLNQPGVPYNIAEMLLRGGDFQSYGFMAVAILCFPALLIALSKSYLSQNGSALRTTTKLFTGLFFVTLLIHNSVTRESLADLVGFGNIHFQLTGDRILGHSGEILASAIGGQNLNNASLILEPLIRFSLCLITLLRAYLA